MKKCINLLLLIIVFTMLISAQTKEIARDNTHLRQGPGCYYPLIGILSKGTVVKVQSEKPGWIETNAQDSLGWISENAVIQQSKIQSGSLSAMSSSRMPTMISRASASGAIRGFAQKFIRAHEGNEDFLQNYDVDFIAPDEYISFKADTYRNRDMLRLRNRYTKLKIGNLDYNIDFDLEKTGMAIAGKIAATGLDTTRSIITYVNLVGTQVLENTELYYHPFKFFVLADERPAAYSTPNGMIFISRGLLNLMDDEAELACVLGHEIAHTVHKHGYQEILKRREMIIADLAFGQLEDELPAEEDTTYQSLEDMTMEMYEAATFKRQMEYEYEADKYGICYAYRAGYDPHALARLLKRVKQKTRMDFWHPEAVWQTDKIPDRAKKIEETIQEDLYRDQQLNFTWKSRFKVYVSSL